MRPLLAIACLALVSATLAGCAEDPLRYPSATTATPSGTSTGSASATGSATGSATSSGTGSANGTSTGGPATVNNNTAPTAELSVTPTNGSAPLNVTFSLGGSDADGDDLSWELDFGDGNQTNGTTLPITVEHTYSVADNYTASLTVSDGSLNRTATARVAAEGAGAPTGPTIEDLCPTDEAAVGHETAGYYITPADNANSPGTLWLYEESNGMPGLQRDDDTVDTECPTPDTIIF